MKNCKYCGAIPREYRDQKTISYDGNPEGNTEEKIFHIVECSKGCHRVVSFKSITNARKQWKEQNIVTKQDMYDEIVSILGHYFDNETLEKVRVKFKQYEAKL